MQTDFYRGKKVLITAGPTYEKIDPVRFIGNYSSGRMGYSIADELAKLGAEVHLVSGPVNIHPEHPSIHLYRVESAIEMFTVCTDIFPDCDIAIMAAAVSDYRPEHTAATKIKKTSNELVIRLVKNPDILMTLGHTKTDTQIVIGFALETDNETENAKMKLEAKNADAIVLNSLKDEGAGFRHDTNKVSILFRKGPIFEFPLKNKQEVAQDIITCISQNF